MATYTAAYFSDVKQHKYDKNISVLEKVVNLGGDYPARKFPDGITDYETGYPYAVDDVIEVIGLRAGTTVLDVEVDLITPAGLYDGARIHIGDGSDTDRYGSFDVHNSNTAGIVTADTSVTDRVGRTGGRFQPYYYSSADTIDVKIKDMYAPYQSSTNVTPTNLITSSTFAAATGWTVDGVKWAIGAGVATRTAGAATPTMVEATTMAAGRYYHSTHDAATVTAGAYSINGDLASTSISAAATNIRLLHRLTTAAAFTITSNATHAGTIDNCYLYLLPQNVAKFKVRAYILEDRRKYKIR